MTSKEAQVAEQEQVVDQIFEGGRVQLDGKTFVRCTFRGTTLVVTGEAPFTLQQSRMENITFQFEGMAARLVAWLKQLRAAGLDVIGS